FLSLIRGQLPAIVSICRITVKSYVLSVSKRYRNGTALSLLDHANSDTLWIAGCLSVIVKLGLIAQNNSLIGNLIANRSLRSCHSDSPLPSTRIPYFSPVEYSKRGKCYYISLFSTTVLRIGGVAAAPA